MKVITFPLVAHLSALFGLLIIVTVAVLTWVGYQRSVDLIEINGQELAEKSAAEVRQAVDAIFAPVEFTVSLLADLRVNGEATWQGRLDHMAVFKSALDVNSPVNAYYVGYRNGDFFMVRRLRSDAERRLYNVDQQVSYIVQSIDWENHHGDGRIIHLDSGGKVLRQIADPAYPAAFDPRERP